MLNYSDENKTELDDELSDLNKLCDIHILDHFASSQFVSELQVTESTNDVYINEKSNVSNDTGVVLNTTVTYKQNKLSDTSTKVQNVHFKKNNYIEHQPKTIVIGTSLVKDVLLREAGVNGYTVCYPGQYVPYIRSRIRNLLESEPVDIVFLQCAGNDLERYPGHLVVLQYEMLIREVRLYAPNAEILIGSVPPRRRNPILLEKINKFNTYLSNRGKKQDGVTFVHAAPTEPEYFKRDNTHFNEHGAVIYVANIVNKIRYLHSFPPLQKKNWH